MSTVRVFRSTDPGAPAHPSATRGSMAALIRACLVDGYGSGSINIDSLSVSGGVGTAAITTNSLDIGTRILIAGANETELNAEWRITAADSSSVTLDMTGISDQTASGTITASIPSAGWEEPYTETNNYSCFQATSGVRQFYQIDDNQTDSDVAYCKSFDSMTSAESGTGLRGESYFGKWYNSTYSNDWLMVADEKTAIICIESIYGFVPHIIGEFYSYLSGDSYKSLLCGHFASNVLAYYTDTPFFNMLGDLGGTASKPIFCQTGVTGAQNASGYAKAGFAVFGGSYMHESDLDTIAAGSGIFYPVVPAHISCTDPQELLLRGHMRGIGFPIAFRPEDHGAILTISGKSWMAVNVGTGSATYVSQIFIDISGIWEESA